MRLEERAEVRATGAGTEEPAASVVALGLEALDADVADDDARTAHGLGDLARLRRRQDQGPVIVVHGSDDLLLLTGVRELGGTQGGDAGLARPVGGGGCGAHGRGCSVRKAASPAGGVGGGAPFAPGRDPSGPARHRG